MVKRHDVDGSFVDRTKGESGIILTKQQITSRYTQELSAHQPSAMEERTPWVPPRNFSSSTTYLQALYLHTGVASIHPSFFGYDHNKDNSSHRNIRNDPK
jgi:hypothetical protein